MVTRATCGLSGRMLAADKVAWGLFLAFPLATLSRVAAEALPAYCADLIVFASTI
jgi:hypothetical protein